MPFELDYFLIRTKSATRGILAPMSIADFEKTVPDRLFGSNSIQLETHSLNSAELVSSVLFVFVVAITIFVNELRIRKGQNPQAIVLWL